MKDPADGETYVATFIWIGRIAWTAIATCIESAPRDLRVLRASASKITAAAFSTQVNPEFTEP
jgi:hypothetical protein